jgi:hypothetical protein
VDAPRQAELIVRARGVSALLLVLTAAAQAQSPDTTQRGTGRLTGEVFDSLFTNAPLADADVVIEGVARIIRTDARGRFRVDSVPTGPHRITFFHPSIDEAGIDARPANVQVRDGETATVRLATPSAQRVYATACGAPPAPGRGLVIGVARAAPSGTIAPLARVVAQWDEVVERQGRIARESPAVLGVATPAGGYVVCNVPTDGEVTVIGVIDDGRRGVAMVLPAGATISTRVLRVADVASAGVRTGAVVRRDGTPVPAVRVVVADDSARSASDDNGRFTLPVGAPAAGELRAAGMGFRPVRMALDSAARSVVITLDAISAQELETITIERRRVESGAPLEFEQRRKAGIGSFITRAQIEARRPVSVVQLFDGVAGISVNQVTERVRIRRAGFGFRNCEPLYFIDGLRFRDVGERGPLSFIFPNDVAGIEVYRGLATVPAQFGGVTAQCGVIVVWTRRGGFSAN